MHLYGKVIVIKRNGTDGAHFPLTARCCVFGRGFDSDIRIQLPTVDTSQCQILVDEKEHVFIQSMSTASSTLINDKTLSEALTALSHGDIITIVDRKFRFEFPTDSKFYPHKSPKYKSPRTPKRASMTRLSASGEKNSSFSKRSTPVTPLSPRTDNVPESIKSPRSASKVSGQPVAVVNDDQFSSPKTGRQLHGSAKKASSPDSFSMSPPAFYQAPLTPGSSQDFSVLSSIPSGGPVNQAFQKSPAATRQKNPGSPYSKTPGSLRKTISDLRRRSVPVFETEEGPVQVQTKVRTQGFATPSVQVGNKRKSTAFDFLSAKRKRVSFGPNLSPEHFDKTLPPKTPIKKGATPSRIIKQERKSLLKAKSPGRKSLSPRTKSPIKVVSTPSSSQVFEVSINTEAFSPAIASPDRSKLQSPKSGLNESDSRRSPRGGSENETSAVGSPGRKLSPANKRNTQTLVKLEDDGTSIIEYLTQEKLLSHAVTNSAPDLGVLSPNTKLEKGSSPLLSGNSSFASSPKSPQRSSPTSSTEKKRSVGRPPSRASLSQISVTPRRSLSASSAGKRSVGRPSSRSKSDSSFRKSVSPRGSFLVSSAEKGSVGRPPSRSSLSFQSSATPGRSFSVSSAEKRSVGRPTSRSKSDSSFRKFVTPVKSSSPLGTSLSVRASLSPKNTPLKMSDVSVLPDDSFFQTSISPRSSMSVSSAEKRPVGRPPSQSKSDSSFRKSITPAKSNSPLETSLSVKASLSPKNTPFKMSGGSVLPNNSLFQTSISPRGSASVSSAKKRPVGRPPSQSKSDSSFRKSITPAKSYLSSNISIKYFHQFFTQKIHKTPKTPRALARALAPTTGHADSPATIIVGRKFKAIRTPKLLPRKGRKVSLSKASRKSLGNTSFTGLSEMFTEPVVNESTLYADIPDTPNGPNEMFVSPLSNRKSGHSGRKSTNLTGVRELFLKKHSQEVNYIGVKELFTSSGASSPVSPSGVGRLIKTSKKIAVSVSPRGVKRLLKTPKIKGIPVSPVGVDNLFKTPTTRPGKNAAKEETVDIVTSPPRKQSRAKKNDSVVPSSPAKGRRGQLKNAAAAETVEIVVPPSTGKRGRPKKNAALKVAASVPDVITPTPKPSPLKGRQGRQKKASTVEIIASPPTKKRGGAKGAHGWMIVCRHEGFEFESARCLFWREKKNWPWFPCRSYSHSPFH
ncbi:unnamed protein product [Candidula unifasciata]|uniref:FHA domain-containing protein n=1 Tax=Candidula unifasciata TaxID=100452 RepID=A0A8S3YYA3_9EUPU|nr:unnamed protein product [Candidula unifasciata]